VQVYKLGVEELCNLRHQNWRAAHSSATKNPPTISPFFHTSITEIPSYLLLCSCQRDVVHPRVQRKQIFVRQNDLFHVRVFQLFLFNRTPANKTQSADLGSFLMEG
jgi:hypothetical protein